MRSFIRHYLLALQFFSRVPVTGRLADWVGFSPATLCAQCGALPRRGLAGGGGSAAHLGLLGLAATQPLFTSGGQLPWVRS